MSKRKSYEGKVGRLSHRVKPELLECIEKTWKSRYTYQNGKKVFFTKKVNYIEFVLDKLNNLDNKSWDIFVYLGGRSLNIK